MEIQGTTFEDQCSLLAFGYSPIPICGKAPRWTGWTEGVSRPSRLKAIRADNPDHLNTGILTGELVMADVDLRDPSHAAAASDTVQTVLGISVLERIGSKGVGLFYRNRKPIPKITISGKPPGQDATATLIEFFGKGGQIAAFGEHPDTGRPYSWPSGSLLDYPLDRLPEVTPAMIREAARAVKATLAELGYSDLAVTGDRSHDGGQPTGEPVTVEMLEAMLAKIDPACDRLTWIKVAGGIKSARVIDRATGDEDPDFDAADLFVRWSSGDLNPDHAPGNYEGPADCDKNFDGLTAGRAGGSGVGTIVEAARAGGYTGEIRVPAIERLRGIKMNGAANGTGVEAVEEIPGDPEPEPVELAANDRPLTGAEFAVSKFPRAAHLWDSMLLEGHPNSIDGDGGIGKTQAMIQIAVAVASGRALFGHDVRQRPVLLILCEDDKGEVRHRLLEACEYLDVDLAGLDRLEVWCRPGEDSTLAVIADNGEWREGVFYPHLEARLEAIGQPCFLGLDTISDVANMDENKRAPMNTFAKLVLGGWSKRFGTTSLVARHPSKASMKDGTHYAGSTSANAAFRNRLRLEAHERGNERTLSVAKSNYGLAGSVDLYHSGAVLRSVTDMEGRQRIEAERESVLDVLKENRAAGVAVVVSHGNGIKPRDLADQLREGYGTTLKARGVLDHLRALQRENRIHWIASTSGRHATAATFEIGPRPEGGTEGGPEAE